MLPVIVFYKNKKQLDEFTKCAFGTVNSCNPACFTYKSLDVITSDRPMNIFSKTLLIFLDIDKKFSKMTVSPKALCIVESANNNAIELLARNGARAIVCGSNTFDTISFSSMNHPSIMICQQRKIMTVDGKMSEPREYPVRLKSKYSISTILLTAALTTVLGSQREEL